MRYKLEDIANFQKGFAFKSRDFIDSGIAIVKVTNLTNDSIDFSKCVYIDKNLYEKHIRYALIQNDIIITTVGSWQTNPASVVGKVVKVPQEAKRSLLNQNAVCVRSNGKVSQKYLYYLLRNKDFKEYILGTAQGSANQASITQKDIRSYNCEIPEKDIQEHIANILSTLDEKIEINDKINKTLEKMAQAIFKHWFIDFQFPNEDGEPYNSSGGEMVESELGMIPKGWEVKSLDQIANYLNGLAIKKYQAKEGEKEIPVLKIKELRQGSTDTNSDLCSENIDRKYIIQDGDVIFSWSGSLLIDIWCGGKCGLNQHLFKVTSEEFQKWFYHQWTQYHLEQFIRIAESKATTMGHIKRKDLSQAKALIPTELIYQKANQLFKPIYSKMISSKIESRKLTQLRNALLPKLMSGEIRVPLD